VSRVSLRHYEAGAWHWIQMIQSLRHRSSSSSASNRGLDGSHGIRGSARPRLAYTPMPLHLVLPGEFALTERTRNVPVLSPLVRQGMLPVVRQHSRVNRLETAHQPVHRGLVAYQEPSVVRVLLQNMSTQRLTGLEGLVTSRNLANQHLRMSLCHKTTLRCQSLLPLVTSTF
jgi:hypothetical protein